VNSDINWIFTDQVLRRGERGGEEKRGGERRKVLEV